MIKAKDGARTAIADPDFGIEPMDFGQEHKGGKDEG